MNTEAKAILALIILVVAGFLAFVFFSDGTEQDPNKPDETSTDMVKTTEPKPDGEKPTETVPTQIKPVEVKPVPAAPGQTSPGSTTPAQVKQAEPKPDVIKPEETKPDAVKPVETKPAAVKSTIANRPLEDLIQVTTPLPNEEISSPLIIEGKARGFWFFEASFPLVLTNSKGDIIAKGVAAAKSDWMTEGFVSFSAELKFTPDYGKSGSLIIHNDNPSDLKENNRELKIPLRFGQQETMEVQVFFCNTKLDPAFSGEKAFPAKRVVPKTQAVARAAMEELLKGTTKQEEADGFFTSINSNVKIQSLSVVNGLAKVDFDKQLEFQVGGSSRVGAIRAQIIQTLTQFSTVEKVIISIDGRTEDILQP